MRTHIAVVLDRSGSMGDIREATLEGFNEFLKAQRASPGEATILLTQFDHEYEVVYNKDIKHAPPLTTETYQPRGSTALLDAIGRTITQVGATLSSMPEEDRPQKVIIVIITDGKENASKEFVTFATLENKDIKPADKIKGMITHQREKYNWEFMFLGANIDALDVGSSMGISPAAAMQYTSQPLEAKAMFRGMARNTSSVREGQRNAFTTDERKAAMTPESTISK